MRPGRAPRGRRHPPLRPPRHRQLQPATARVYTDLGLLTCRPELIGDDAADLFNHLTGYSRNATYGKLLVAPEHAAQRLLELIEREIAHQPGRRAAGSIAKMNSLVDAGDDRGALPGRQAGVKIDLIVRGICCLRPGVPG